MPSENSLYRKVTALPPGYQPPDAPPPPLRPPPNPPKPPPPPPPPKPPPNPPPQPRPPNPPSPEFHPLQGCPGQRRRPNDGGPRRLMELMMKIRMMTPMITV